MIRRLFWSLFVVVLACSSGSTAEIRRIVTGIDQNNKAVVLFNSIDSQAGRVRQSGSKSVDHRFTAARFLFHSGYGDEAARA